MYDIAVVGYGPVGMATAALLGGAGHRVVVLERHPTLYNLPRAAIFDDETMRTFARLGIADRMLPLVHVQRNYEWRNGGGELLIEHEFSPVGRSGWAEWYMMYQPDLEDALDDTCRALPNVEIRQGSRVVGYEQDDTGVRVLLDDDRDVLARHVVACDGGHSFTRQWLGIDQDDYGFSEPWMVCDFRLTAEVDLPMARQVCDPRQPISIISLGPRHHRFSFMLDSAEAFATESQTARVWQRVGAFLDEDHADLIRVATYTFRSRIAHSWRSGRILLAGDAAHQMPPFLGQGMCSGIRDAQNLAFKLDRVLRGESDPSLLDTYQTEREPHVRAVVEKGIELGRVQTTRDPVAAAARDARLIAAREAHQKPEKMRFPGLGPGLVAVGTPGAGTLVPQGRVGDGERSGRFDEVLGHGFTVLVDARDGAPGTGAAAEAAAELGARVWHIGERATTDAVADLDGVYGAWFDETGCAAVIVRPDHYVYGTADSASGLANLIDRLRAALALSVSPVSTSP
jgi:3-(3-hydroxy-phenyl)propionate hydroxylase/flavoprotein hydroxylase